MASSTPEFRCDRNGKYAVSRDPRALLRHGRPPDRRPPRWRESIVEIRAGALSIDEKDPARRNFLPWGAPEGSWDRREMPL